MSDVELIRPDDPRVSASPVHSVEVSWGGPDRDLIEFAFRDGEDRQRAALQVTPEFAQTLADGVCGALAVRAGQVG